ncbi:MAG: hypothetical protein SO114_04305 [Candidatus Cryptobacteroides sp.]|nr:hypothetical protein [Candidatus Cryptobacteroides sp.]
MKNIANQSLFPSGRTGYDSPEIKAVNFKVEAGSTVSGSGSVETWTEDSMIDAEW